jgi:uncharacterized protein YdiU (UPF0061 family)
VTRTADATLFDFDHSFSRSLAGLYVPWQAAPIPAARLLELNDTLAVELGLDPDVLRTPEGVLALVGNTDAAAASSIAQAYAGHQFGNYSPRLGDGRALLLGELVDVSGNRFDVHLKGSGRTPFARGGDGKAAVGPMLREYVMSEAMHALGIPTTRSLAVAATGEPVQREVELPGAVLVRIASSHLRVGSFQYAAATGDEDLLRRLADYAIERHHPDLADGDPTGSAERYLTFYERVVGAQAELVAQWMLVGFIHGVLNTDNVTISGETIDYGPCAFMDEFDPATVFSSIDHAGRYAYGNQAQITQWNLARLGETLLPLLAEDADAAVELATGVLAGFPERYATAFDRGVRAKLGLRVDEAPQDETLVDDWFRLLHEQSVDLTSAFRSLSAAVRGEAGAARELFDDGAAFDAWAQRWRAEWSRQTRSPDEIADGMDAVNPIYIPRNHLVEAALDAATAGDLTLLDQLLEVVRNPYVERPGTDRYALPAPQEFGPHRTFCGT